MSTYSRLTKVYNTSKKIKFDNSSKIVMFSDCHRGDSSWADNFASNKNIYLHALDYYYDQGFTYFELGDGDELWENKYFADIKESHLDVFHILRKFYIKHRFYMLWGNHDLVKKNPSYIYKNFFNYTLQENKVLPLFDNLKTYEGLILVHSNLPIEMFLVHGHQGDLINDSLWLLGRFLCRYFWRPLEILGVNNPSSPAKNYRKKNALEKQLIKWVNKNNKILIAGHLHLPAFSYVGQGKYFNTGSCIHPYSITCIEIDNDNISLIRWSTKVNHDGTLYIGKNIIAGPTMLESYFE